MKNNEQNIYIYIYIYIYIFVISSFWIFFHFISLNSFYQIVFLVPDGKENVKVDYFNEVGNPKYRFYYPSEHEGNFFFF